MDNRDTPLTPREASAGQEETARSGPLRSLAADPFASLPMDFGPYRILKLIGRGGMGAVYLARDPEQNRDVAIKVARASAAGSRSLQTRMEREARALALLDHPNICKLYDFGTVGEIRYLALEYIEGENLKAAMTRVGRKRKPANAVQMMIQLARAVGMAHERGIIHRDLKPENVMRRPNGRLVIMDFGLNRQSVQRDWDPEKTRDGAVLGTPAYMSPEQAEGLLDQVDERSDIYSLGVMLFEMLTGEWPFQGTSISIMGQKITKPTPDILGFNAALPRGLAAVCQKMVCQRREDRFASCAEIVQALREIDLRDLPSGNSGVLAAVEGTDLFEFMRESDSADAPLHQRVLGRRPTKRMPKLTPWGQAAVRPVAKCARAGWNWWSELPRSMQWTLTGAFGVVATLAFVLFSATKTSDAPLFPESRSPDVAATTELPEKNLVSTTANHAVSSGGGGLPASAQMPAETSTPSEESRPEVSSPDVKPAESVATPVVAATASPIAPAEPPSMRSIQPVDPPVAEMLPDDSEYPPGPSYVQLPPFPLLETDSLTIEMTIDAERPPSVDQDGVLSGTILSNRREAGIRLRATQLNLDVEILARNQVAVVPTQLSSKGAPWKRGRIAMATVLDGGQSEARLYVNGRLAQKRALQGRLTEAWNPLVLGAELDGSDQPVGGFAGTIDEIRISQVDRYRDEYKPVSRFAPDRDTLALYHCDEGSGDELLDTSPAKRHGQVYGATWVPSPGPKSGSTVADNFQLAFNVPPLTGPIRPQSSNVAAQSKATSRPAGTLRAKRGPPVVRSSVIKGPGMWRVVGEELVQTSTKGPSSIMFGNPAWQDYTVSFEAMRVEGTEGYHLFFRGQTPTHTKLFGIGSYGNSFHEIVSLVQGKWERQTGSLVLGAIRNREWEQIRLTVVGNQVQGFLNGKLILEESESRFPQGGIGLQTWETAVRFRRLLVTAPDGTILWEGFPDIPPH